MTRKDVRKITLTILAPTSEADALADYLCKSVSFADFPTLCHANDGEVDAEEWENVAESFENAD